MSYSPCVFLSALCSEANLAQSAARVATLTNRRPLPPVEIDPEALANLRHYGLSARAITGGIVAGQGEEL